VRGARRQEFDTHDLMARTIFACGADIVAIGGAFQVVLGCKTAIMDALALIKSEEEARRTESADARCPRAHIGNGWELR
jgi:hypothetical protein